MIAKRYHDDLSISYQMQEISTGRRVWISEHQLLRWGGGGYERLFRVPRTIVMTEKTFTGVLYGNS